MNGLWEIIDVAAARTHGGYIAISGNTGSGKSTLINSLSSELNRLGLNATGVNERVLHHPLLPKMFESATTYALPVQVNFIVQRALFLIRAIENGHLVILERSHYDDRLFVEDHRARGNISSDELDAYSIIARSFHRHIPEPDIFVLLNTSPATSFERICLAEARGERPVEFPSDAVKRSFVEAWHRKYEQFFEQLRTAKATGRFARTEFIEFSEADQSQQMVIQVAKAWLSRHESGRPDAN